LLGVRREHFLTTGVSLSRVRVDRLLKVLERTDRIVIDDEIEIGSEVSQAFLEKVVLREERKRVVTGLKIEKAERYGGGQNCLGRSALDA
jgi:hypothetical protein